MKLWKETIENLLLFVFIVVIETRDMILVDSTEFNYGIHLVGCLLQLEHTTTAT